MTLAACMTILGMAVVTYLTRILGYLILRNRNLSPGTRSVLESAPGCVMISAIAPYFASGNPAQIIALIVAAGCAIRLSMLPTLIISVATLGILQLIIS